MIEDAMAELLALARQLADAKDAHKGIAAVELDDAAFDASFAVGENDYDPWTGREVGSLSAQAAARDLLFAAADRLAQRYGLAVAREMKDGGKACLIAIGFDSADAERRLTEHHKTEAQMEEHRQVEAAYESGDASPDEAFGKVPPRRLAQFRADILDYLPSQDVAKGPTYMDVGCGTQIPPYIVQRILKRFEADQRVEAPRPNGSRGRLSQHSQRSRK